MCKMYKHVQYVIVGAERWSIVTSIIYYKTFGFGSSVRNILFFQAEDGIRDAQESRRLGDVYKRQRYQRPSCAGPLTATCLRSNTKKKYINTETVPTTKTIFSILAPARAAMLKCGAMRGPTQSGLNVSMILSLIHI